MTAKAIDIAYVHLAVDDSTGWRSSSAGSA